MKKIIIFILATLLIISPYILDVKAETLRGYQEALAELEANRDEYERQQEEARERAKKYQADIQESMESIDEFGKEIQESKEKITELEAEIVAKEQEIEDLLTFLQLSNGENVYLEYVFGAQDFTDFIFRTSIVEQLSNHNDALIVEMNGLIEENKQLQEELAQKIKDEEKAIKDFEKKLKDANLEVTNIEGYYKDIDAEIAAQKEIIKFYEEMECDLDEDINDCMERALGTNISISATNFNIPIRTGTITSEWGYRSYWLNGEWVSDFHNGIDIGVREGTKVYASTFGVVKYLISRSSCGGNIVYIEHTVNGEKMTTRYLHLLSYTVKLGDVVTPTTVIGYSGGSSTASYNGGYDYCTGGAHLHFEIREGWGSQKGYWNIVSVNPRTYITFPSSW